MSEPGCSAVLMLNSRRAGQLDVIDNSSSPKALEKQKAAYKVEGCLLTCMTAKQGQDHCAAVKRLARSPGDRHYIMEC